MPDDTGKNASPLRWILVLAVFVGVLIAVKFLLGVAMAIFKWVVIGAVALLVTWLIFRKAGSGRGD